ncbi:hypothetical protein [Actinoplanes solisilvae]|uniref:hypothetical protein n=1 Tax=Actinoplanes solisilvae TaxID=2486853 RepID=UPI000FD6C355|nr:hypothetical protein [Actinoplanes solisilvae]
MTERENDSAEKAETPAGGSAALPSVAVPATEELAAPPIVQDETGPSRVGCRTELHGWAGAHLHGAVRPRRRAAGRGRPPGRWC